MPENSLRRSVSILLLAAGGAACHKRSVPAAPPKEPVAVRVSAAEPVAGAGTRSVPATVAARRAAEISSRVAATVTAVFVQEGERVRRGQSLASLDSRDVRARIAAARAAAGAAAAEKERVDRLAAGQAATPREQEMADSAAVSAKASLEEATAALSYLQIPSPFDGRVASVPVHEGDLVLPGQRIVVVEADAGFEIQADIEADAAQGLSIGSRISVRVDGIADPLTAAVASLSPAGDPQTHRFLLRANLPGDPRLRSGLFATASVPAPESEPAGPTIPAAALVDRGGLTGVFVVEKDLARLRWVSPGNRLDGLVEIRAGLAPGELVVVSPGDLEDGAPVRTSR